MKASRRTDRLALELSRSHRLQQQLVASSRQRPLIRLNTIARDQPTYLIALCFEGQGFSSIEAAKYESLLLTADNNKRAHLLLLGYHCEKFGVLSPQRKHHILWLIRHAPELRLFPFMAISRQLDVRAYMEAFDTWKTVLDENGCNPYIVVSAAQFFELDWSLLSSLLKAWRDHLMDSVDVLDESVERFRTLLECISKDGRAQTS